MEANKIQNFLKSHNSYISTKEIENLGISRVKIPKLIENCIIRKVAYGLYIDEKIFKYCIFL